MESRVWLAVGKILGHDASVDAKLHMLPSLAQHMQRNQIDPDGKLTEADEAALLETLQHAEWAPVYAADGARIQVPETPLAKIEAVQIIGEGRSNVRGG
jgi:hypothetical protein